MSEQGLIIIVGPGKDLGIELARKFGKQGYGIVLMGRDMTSIQSKTLQLRQEGVDGYAIGIDVTDGNSVAYAFQEVDKLNKPVCGLIYNAVARRIKHPSELLPEDVEADMKVCLSGAMRCTLEILQRYTGCDDEFILYTGGGVALMPSVPAASMSIGKAALRNYVLNLAEELKDNALFIGIVTITRKIEYGTDCSPETVADVYTDLLKTRETAEKII